MIEREFARRIEIERWIGEQGKLAFPARRLNGVLAFSLAGVVGSAILVGIAAGVPVLPTFSASFIYSVCLVTMLGCSAAYNLAANASRREFLRQLDHAAIFLMIAGTYTPFTTCRLHGVWAIGMTAAVWTGAVTGAVMKLICPRRIERVSTVAYLALGWIILVGMRPLLSSVDVQTAVLIGVGGVLYSIRAGFHLWRALPFHNAIWHSFVLVTASCHYEAILHGRKRHLARKCGPLTAMIREGVDLKT